MTHIVKRMQKDRVPKIGFQKRELVGSNIKVVFESQIL
jgi:hypothetical protein